VKPRPDTPRARGFHMPPEHAPHAATWTAWPVDDALWEGELDGVRDDMAHLVAALARFEPVELLVRDDEARDDAHARLERLGVPHGVVRMHPAAYDDVWLRDSGPAFVLDASGDTALVDFRFDGWGGKYAAERDDRIPALIEDVTDLPRFPIDLVMEGGAIEMGDDGTVLTTRSCLLDGVRNPGLDEAGYERALREALGATRVAWLAGGLVDDHTDGHVDTVVRFAGDDVVLCTVPDEDDAVNHATLHANRTALEALRRADGSPYRVVPLPLPEDRSTWHGVRPPRSYANFCRVNGGVIVPVWDDPRDADAIAILGEVFENREVVPVLATHLVTGGGALHCVTQHQPLGARPK